MLQKTETEFPFLAAMDSYTQRSASGYLARSRVERPRQVVEQALAEAGISAPASIEVTGLQALKRLSGRGCGLVLHPRKRCVMSAKDW